jgi:hypothetical protein
VEILIYSDYIKFILTSLAIISAIFVISTKNAVISVFNLIVLYILVAFYLIYIGITYLGISYIVIVRRIYLSIEYFIKYNQCSHLITVSELSKEEISKLNLASLLEAKVRKINNRKRKILLSLIIYHFLLKIIKKSIIFLQTVFSKVKAELLKVNKIKKYNKLNTKEVTKKEIINLINFILWFIKRTFSNYSKICTNPINSYILYKKKNLLPKENERILIINTGRSTSYFGYDFRMIILLRLFWTQFKNLIYNRINNVVNSLINHMNRGRIITYILNKNRIGCLNYLNLKYNIKNDFKVFSFKNKLNENNYIDSIDHTKPKKNSYSLIYNLNFLKIAFLNIVLIRNKRKWPEYLILNKILENKLTYDLVPIILLQNIKKEVKSNKFVFSGKRISKVNINNKNEILHNKNEILHNIPLKDKLIKEALSLYIETQLENRDIFTVYNTSTNILFPKNGNNINIRNKALFYIKNEFQNIIWIIKGDCDLNTFFKDSFIIKGIFKKITLDKYFLDLLSSYLDTEYFRKAILLKNKKESRINNLLLKIILKELDNLILKLKKKLEDRKMERELKNHNNQNVSLSYLRYGRKFILGIKGTEKQAESLRKSILGFLNIKNIEEIKRISQWSFYSKEILFLDTLLKLERGRDKNIINLIAPLKLICRKLKARQFIKGLNKSGIFTSCPKYSWLSKNHDQIINLYNNLIIKICNNYLLVDNYDFLVKTLIYYLKGSCAKLLATKFNLKTQSKVYKKFGYDLKSPNGLKFIRLRNNKI